MLVRAMTSSERMNARPLPKYDLKPPPTTGRASTRLGVLRVSSRPYGALVEYTLVVSDVLAKRAPAVTYGWTKSLSKNCQDTDRASAALVKDLKQRGLLDDTLVIWGGEFGRTPMVETNAALGRSLGRDHHPHAYTMWMAGGGTKPGLQLGVTDELGYSVVEDPVHVHDLQATILHCLGLDHERLTYRYSGRDFRLTDVHGHVVKKLLA